MNTIKKRFESIKSILERKDFLIKKNNVYIDKRTKDYSSNFGLQWNEFSKTQLDSYTGFPLTRKRLFNSSEWGSHEIKDKLIVELGSGAGRFTEILLSSHSYVISVEMSNAIHVNALNNKSDKIIFLKSSLNNLSFLDEFFDYVLCYGVAQHTPNVLETYKACYCLAKKGGKISVDHYEKLNYPTLKSIWRPITKKINSFLLFRIIKFYIPIFFSIDTIIKTKLPNILSRLIRILLPIPCVNYTNKKDIPQDKKELIEWAIMDTFDVLGAKYDNPLSSDELTDIAKKIGLNNFTVKNGDPVIILNGTK